ncbi:MAG TPA: hypothetical protein VF056_09270 [Thermoleophilaceae bacterium]
MTARALLLVPASLAILAALPAPAAADGLPGTGVVPSPVSAPGGDVEYVAKRAKRDTILREQRLDGGPALRLLHIRGRYSVPAVAYDGSPSGLSADGRTLVLINPRRRWPRKRTTFAVIDARRMEPRRQIRLRGDFSFDAISPDGRIAYFIEYLSPRDATAYAVRAYDMRARRLFQEPVVDPSEPDEDMSGVPLSRVSDAAGRWAYTLYSGHEHPFVHALDTERRRAVCIDLDLRTLRGAALELHGGRLDVVGDSGLLARIDTVTHRVTAAPGKPPERATASAGTPWLLIAGPTAALMLLAAVGRRRSATRTAVP